MESYNSQLTTVLRKAGWNEGRDDPLIELEYQNTLGEAWMPEAGPFVRSFGNLTIGQTLLMVYADATNYIGGVSVINKVKEVIRSPCCPVAESRYTGDGGTLWIDAKRRFYFVDSEGIIFLGKNTEEALSVLLVPETKPAPPPAEIGEALKRAYEWNKFRGDK